MLNAKRLMSIVLVIAMVVTMASFPVSASSDPIITPVGASSPFGDDGNPIGNAIDSSWTNHHRPAGTYPTNSTKGADGNWYFVVDFGTPYNVTSFRVKWSTNFTTAAALYGSNDNETWTEIADLTFAAQETTNDISHEGYYRYVKIESYKLKANNPAVFNVEFRGDSDPTIVKVEGLTAANVEFSGAGLRSAAKSNMDTLFDGKVDRTPSSAEKINGLQYTWSGSATVKNIEITLNEVSDIYILKLFWGNSDYNALPAQTYNVYFAGEDGTYGSAAYSYTDDATKQNGKSRDDMIKFDTPVEAVKKIKIEVTAHYTAGDLALREIEIIEKLDPNEVKWANYTVEYVDTEGNPMFDSKVVKNKVAGKVVTETAEEVPGYRIVEGNPQTVTLVEGDNTITFTYEKLPDIEYTVKYVDENGNPVAPEKTGVAVAPYEVTEMAVYVDGYYKPATVTKTLSETDKVIEFVYEATPERMVPTVEDLLKNATVKTTGQDNNKNVAPEHLIDNNSTTFSQASWSKTPNYTVIVDLHGNYDISNIGLTWCGGTSQKWDVSNGGVRPTKYTIAVSADGTNYTTIYTYNNSTRTDSRDDFSVSDFTESPRDVRYVKINATEAYLAGRVTLYEVDVNGYAVCDRVLSAPSVGLYATGSTGVHFPISLMTVDATDPLTYLDVANWVLDNCEIEVTVEDVSDPASIYYTWDVNVLAKPIDAEAPFSMDLDLPDSYMMTDGFNFYLEPSDLLFDSAIAAGQNAIILNKSDFVLNYKEDGTLTDDSANVANRSITMMLQVQSVIEDGLPYEGYDEIVIELKEFRSKGDRVRYYLDEFVRSGDYYLASLLVTKAGVDQLEAVIGIYGVKADGTKVELDTRTITSDLINIEAKYPVPKTKAQTVKDYTFPMDVLDQLIGVVHPADLPTYSDDEWAFFREILIARGWKKDDGDEAKGIPDSATKEINRVRTALEAELAKLEDPNWIPDKEYADGTVSIINGYYEANTSNYKRCIRMGTEVWNLMASLHVDSFSVYGPVDRPTGKALETGFENDIVDAYVTFREGIDYNYGEKWTENTGFCIRMKFVGTSAEYANITLGNAYNSVRRALNDDQVSPILFRLDWYNWAKNPFEGGVITVQITDSWAENYGLYNLAVYHMSGYKYSEDNDATLELMEDGICITNPAVKEVSVVIEGAQKMYDTYAIVGTEKIPSDEPEVNGTYFDVK